MAQPVILIIDDDDELRLIYRQTLERHDYEVLEASEGASAMQMIIQHKPDVIILDMMMPRMNGSALLQMLEDKKRFPPSRLIVITAYPHFRETALSFEVDQFLSKPVRPNDVINAVRAALDDHSSLDSSAD